MRQTPKTASGQSATPKPLTPIKRNSVITTRNVHGAIGEANKRALTDGITDILWDALVSGDLDEAKCMPQVKLAQTVAENIVWCCAARNPETGCYEPRRQRHPAAASSSPTASSTASTAVSLKT